MPARRRFVVSLFSLGLALAFVAAGGAALDEAGRSGSAQAPALRFTSGSQRVVAGQAAFVAVAVRPGGVRCSVAVRYANGSSQSGLKPIRAVNGQARWTWRLAERAAPGAASVTVACDRVGRRSRALLVVRPPIPASVVVVKQGFSQRLSRSGTSSSLSFGIMLANPSPDQDALDVTVLVNAIDASNRVVQTATARVAAVGAASSFGTAGQMSLGIAPVSRLELVVQLGARVPKAPLVYPVLANAQIVPSRFDKGYIGGVEGEFVNERLTHILSRTRVFAVLFDPAGNVVGGGSGSSSSVLPPGARTHFSASSGFGPVALDRGVAVQIFFEPSYQPVS